MIISCLLFFRILKSLFTLTSSHDQTIPFRKYKKSATSFFIQLLVLFMHINKKQYNNECSNAKQTTWWLGCF